MLAEFSVSVPVLTVSVCTYGICVTMAKHLQMWMLMTSAERTNSLCGLGPAALFQPWSLTLSRGPLGSVPSILCCCWPTWSPGTTYLWPLTGFPVHAAESLSRPSILPWAVSACRLLSPPGLPLCPPKAETPLGHSSKASQAQERERSFTFPLGGEKWDSSRWPFPLITLSTLWNLQGAVGLRDAPVSSQTISLPVLRV